MLAGALREIQDAHAPGTHAHDTAHAALDCLHGLRPKQVRHPSREVNLITDDERDYELDSADIPSGWHEDAEPQPAPGLAAVDALEKVVSSHERVMYAATIDLIRGDPESALRTLDEQLDGWDGAPWNAAETGAQWLERTRDKPPTAAQQERAAAREPHALPDLEVAAVIAERNQLRWALKRLADDGNLVAREHLAAIGEARITKAQPAPEQDPVMHRLSGIIAGWRSYVRSAEEGFPTDREGGRADALREVNRQVEELLPDLTALAERAYATAPQSHPAPGGAPSPVLLDAYKGDNHRLHGRLGDLLGRFAPDGIGYRASLSATELAQEYRDVPLPVPDQLRHLEER
jgi:hypothetical protein